MGILIHVPGKDSLYIEIVPLDEIYGCPIFQKVAETWFHYNSWQFSRFFLISRFLRKSWDWNKWCSFHVTPMIISFRIFLWKAKLPCLLYAMLVPLTHWGRAMRICVGNLTIIGSDNGLSPGRRQAIIWTNARIFLIRPLGTNLSEILIRNQIFSFIKMHLKMLSAKWHPFFLGLNVLTHGCLSEPCTCVSKLGRTGTDNGLFPVWHQAIIWIHGGLLSLGPLKNFNVILIKIKEFSFSERKFCLQKCGHFVSASVCYHQCTRRYFSLSVKKYIGLIFNFT